MVNSTTCTQAVPNTAAATSRDVADACVLPIVEFLSDQNLTSSLYNMGDDDDDQNMGSDELTSVRVECPNADLVNAVLDVPCRLAAPPEVCSTMR